MSEYIKVAVDAMGGDYAPQEPVKGVIDALNEKPELFVYLVGQEEVLKKELEKYSYPKDRLEVVHASEIIETGEPPVQAIQKKKDSSLVKALRMVRSQEASAFVSCGSTGAVLVGGQVLVGKSKGVERMGSIYMEYVMGVKNPKVGLVNIGAEEEKGNALVKETFPLLKECKDINFIGNVEARDIPKGVCDVVVCEAFVGNVILKLYEGVGSTLISKVKAGMMSSLRSKIGALLVKPALKETLKSFDASEYGGAPLLGLKGLVVKAHGSSKANEIKNSLIQCIAFSKEDICGKIQENMKQEKKGEN